MTARSRSAAAAVAATVATACLFAVAPAASAEPCGEWQLEMSSLEVPLGGEVRVTGAGFGDCSSSSDAPAPAEDVVLSLVQGTTVTEVATVQPGTDLAFTASFVVPDTVRTGPSQLKAAAGAPVAFSVSPGATTSLPVTAMPAAPQLAYTGPPAVGPLALAGAGSVGLGVMLLALARRRLPAS